MPSTALTLSGTLSLGSPCGSGSGALPLMQGASAFAGISRNSPTGPGSLKPMRRDAHEKEGLSLATEPADILEAAKAAAQLRGITVGEVAKVSRDAAIAAFPRLPGLLALPDAFAKRFGSSQLD